MSTRLLVLGADALDKDLVLRWADDGTLPTFRRLLATGAWGITDSPPGLFVGAVWPSFWTASSPARHARYCFEQLRPGTYEKVRIHPTDTQVPPFWEALSNAGRRVALLDVPKTYVSKGLNGVQVVDWGTHDPDFEGPLTWPESLAEDLVARFGRDAVGNCNAHGRAGEYATLRDQLVARVATRGRLISDVVTREDWDCVVAVFSESHCVGHQCWHVHDTSHPRHDPAVAESVGNPMRDVYRAIDAEIGRLIDTVGPGTDVIVFGSHGMRSHFDATFLLDEMLLRIENPKVTPAVRTSKKKRPLAKRLWAKMPSPLRRALSPFKEPAKARLGLQGPATRLCFAVPNNDAYGAVRINLAGREPAGRVSADQLDAYLASLTADLKSFVNLDTGEPLVRGVMRASEFYRGPNMAHLPDLMIEWNRDTPVERIHSPKTGEIRGAYTKCRTGDHSPLGIFFAAGSGVAPGPLTGEFTVMDYGPTVAERLGVALRDVDGRSFARVFGSTSPA